MHRPVDNNIVSERDLLPTPAFPPPQAGTAHHGERRSTKTTVETQNYASLQYSIYSIAAPLTFMLFGVLPNFLSFKHLLWINFNFKLVACG